MFSYVYVMELNNSDYVPWILDKSNDEVFVLFFGDSSQHAVYKGRPRACKADEYNKLGPMNPAVKST